MRLKICLMTFFTLAFLLSPVFSQDEEVLSLSLEEAILKAFKNNLDIAVEVYNPELAGLTVTRAKEVFMPRFDFSYGRQQQETPPTWWIQGTENLVSKYLDYGVSIVQQIPLGGNLSLSMTNTRSNTNQAFQLINPQYGSTLRFDFSQPLLKNFGATVNRREIIIAEHNLDITQNQLKAVLLDTIYSVQEAYWNLVFAIEDYKVKQQSLQLARDLLQKNRKEVEFGQLAPIEILNAETVVASREADILQAEAMIKRSEDILKNIMNLAQEGETGIVKLVPSDKPEFIERDVHLDEALSDALVKRPELQSSKKSIETRELNLNVARNQMLPGLNLEFSYWSPGISGDRILYEDDNPLFGKVIGREKGSSTDSLRDALKLLYNNWTVGLTLSLPLSSVLTRADLARAKVELDQSQTQLKNLEQDIILQVKDAVRTIDTNAKRVHAYRLAREFAERRLAAEEKKLNVGLSTNYFVLEFQDGLANARSMELKALIDYNLSLALLEKVAGSSLEKRNITLSQITDNR